MKAVTSQLDYDSDSNDGEYAFSIEGVGMIKEKSKQLIATLPFTDENTNFSTEIGCQLDTGATCNVITHRDLSIINQYANPKLQQSNVKLRLFDGSVMHPLGEVKLKVSKEHCLKFQVINGKQKPILSVQTCQTLELLKISERKNLERIS